MAGATVPEPVSFGVMNRSRLLVVALGLMALASACARSTERGRVLYVEQRFIEAAEVFEHSESQLSEYEVRDRASYGLYRGMTLLRLGDLDGAARWLYYAQTSVASHSGALSPPELRALQLANNLLEETRGREPGSPNPLGGAVARSTTAESLETDRRSADQAPQSASTRPTHANP